MKKKILYGICGIGQGHVNRQLPILTHYVGQGHEVLAFAYGSSLHTLKPLAKAYGNLTLQEVSVPYVVGTPQGLDFEASAKKVPAGSLEKNFQAMDHVSKTLGTPDLVLSDYEPISAQYAYAHGAPLITIDQQSKYLCGEFAENLHGQGYRDEVMRLGMFFPKAHARIACSFFDVTKKDHGADVILCPPILRPEILEASQGLGTNSKTIVIYLSEQQIDNQPIQQMLELVRTELKKGYAFVFYLPRSVGLLPSEPGVQFYHHGDLSFDQELLTCAGVITTAGHTLLSECMHLGIPVLALPLSIYEQQMNSAIIHDHGFGLRSDKFSAEILEQFLGNLDLYRETIRRDEKILLRGSGLGQVLGILNHALHL